MPNIQGENEIISPKKDSENTEPIGVLEEVQNNVNDILLNPLQKASVDDHQIENLDRLKGFNNEVMCKLIEEGQWDILDEILQKYEGFDLEIAIKLIEAGVGYGVAIYLDKFEGINHLEMAISIIEAGYGDDVAQNLEKFKGIYHSEIAIKLIEAGEGARVARFLEKFEGIKHSEIAIKLIEVGLISRVAMYFEKFEGIFHSKIAIKFIEEGLWEIVAGDLDKFEKFNNDVAIKLIEAGELASVAYNVEKFEGINHSELAIKLIKVRKGASVVNNLEKFNGLNHSEIAIKMIEAGAGASVVRFLEKFNGLNHSELAIQLIEAREGYSVANNLDKFKGINHSEIAIKLIEVRGGDSVASNVEKFKGINHSELAITLIEAGEGANVADNLEKFEGINHSEIAITLIEAGEGASVANNIEKFNGLNHSEIAIKIIEAGVGYSVARFLENFERLNNEVALKLIEAREGDSVVNNLEKFKGIDSIHTYLKYFPVININIFTNFNEQYEKKNSEFIDDFLSKINELKSMVVSGEDYISYIEGVTEKDIAELIYPRRDFSPKNIENYIDASQDLDNYIFNNEGYNFTLSNLLGYKLGDGEEMNEKLLEAFQVRVSHIATISQNESTLGETVKTYAQKEGIELDSNILESQILEYLLKKESKAEEININDFDLLIAYQLMGKYDEFMKGSNDKLVAHADQETQHMIQIQALLKEYGDPLKETIRTLESVSLGSEDKQFFESYVRNIPTEVRDLTKQKTLKSMIRSFSNRPQETITDEVVRISIDKKLKGVLQGMDITVEERNMFCNEFHGEDFRFGDNEQLQVQFMEKWINIVEDHFGSVDSVSLNIKSIARTQDTIYQTLQTESNKFESITDQGGKNKDRRVFARFGKSKYDACARGVGDVCIGTDSEMWKNKDYFELVLFDQERQKNIGTVMLLNMEEENGDTYLLFCPNPSVEFDDKVSSQKLFDQISEIVKTFAIENNYNGVLFDPTHGKGTNRSGDFQKALGDSQLKENNKVRTINLNQEYELSERYFYQNNLSYLWER